MAESSAGLALLLFSLACLGSWPALLDLACLRGTHPCHAYMDYAAVVLACAIGLALASAEPVLSVSCVAVVLAAAGGCLLMLGNLSMQRALLMGVPLSVVLPIQGSLAVTLGTTINWTLQPERSDARLLFLG
eukprot:7076718-Prymnesium_polylepis.1